MKPKKKFSYAEQSQRLRVKKVSKDEDLFAKLCEIFGSSTLELQQTLAQNSNQSEEEVNIGLIDGIWKAVPVSVTPENEMDTKMDELPYSTESCVVEVPTIGDQYKELNNNSEWDIDSTFAEAESLASFDDSEILKNVSDIKDALSETQDISVKNVLPSRCISTSRKTSSASSPPANADVDGTVKSVSDIKKALTKTQDLPFKNSPSKQSVVNSKKNCSVSSSRAATKLSESSEKCDNLVQCQRKSGNNIGKSVDKKMKRKVDVCLSNLEVKSLQDELALELKKAVEEFAKKRNNLITTKNLEKDSAVQSAISTIDNPEITKSVYQSQYFVDVEQSDKSIFSRGCSERSSGSSVELPLALMLSKPKVEDTSTDTKSNVYDSVYEASVTEYEPESPRDSLENFDFGDKVERNSISSSTDSGVPSSGGSKDSPVPDERQLVPISLTFYTNPALEIGINSPILSEGTVNSGFEADRNCDEDTEETYKQIVIDVAEKGEKRIRFASSMESINSISTYNEVHEPKKQNSNYVISLALSAVRIWTQIKSYLAQSKTQAETVIENPEDEINYFTQPAITELNTKVAKPVTTGIRRIGSDLHVKYVQIARDRRWLPKARIHQETSDWLQDIPKGLNSFEELRKYVKDGGDMAKEISNILQERSDLDSSYAKGLSKLAAKMMKVSRESSGTIAAAWQAVGSEMEAESELHKTLAVSLSEDLVKPFRHVIETEHRTRKGIEVTVDKTARSLAEWRATQAKAKKQCYMCARDNEKMQDVGFGDSRHGRSRTLSEKETVKLGLKRRKSEEALRKADVEYYAYCVRAERARLDWEAATNRGSRCFQAIEEERLTQMRDVASQYLSVVKNLGPKLVQSADRLNIPIARCSIDSDLQTVVSLRSAGPSTSEQLLPDFYAEHMSNVMNRDRRKETLEKCLKLICGDIEREKRAKTGVENLSRALQENPNFGTDESQQEITDKLKHLRSMLAFLEATKVKVSNAVADIENKPKTESPFVKYLEVHKDKQGLIQSVLKLPSWAQDLDSEGESPTGSDSPDFIDEGTLDEGQPDSDFDEFSSPESDSEDYSHSAADSLSPKALKNPPPLQQEIASSTRGNSGRCRALYTYTANMYDELTIHPGDIISIHDKQEDGWWVGEHEGNIGIFPATYVEELED